MRGGRLVLERLKKLYPGFTAVDGLDLDVAAGEFLTLLGPSGSGKTTTLMMVAGFTTPSDGRILLNDRSIAGLAPEKRNIGVVFQNYALFPHMTVAENVAFPLRMRGEARAAIAARVGAALDLVQLTGLGARMPRQLSGGQQQRVAFARALVFDPDLLLMDEPLGALDKNLREQMQFELKRLHRELGVTILYVTHDQEEALTMSDRIALLNRGAIAQLGRAEELYERPANRFVAEFIGESNVIEGRLERGEAGAASWFRAVDGVRLPIALDGALDRAVDGATDRLGASLLLVLRPEKLRLGAPRATADQALRGRVVELVYVGDVTRYRIAVGDGLCLTVKVQNSGGAPRAAEGEAVDLVYDPADARVVAA
ncbi:MAG TPA: ABC transporter ATP-binding protein [Stellaceae bacterium]|nr:ABC transporter ATP-binding protein [Stellaceae bacterium]